MRPEQKYQSNYSNHPKSSFITFEFATVCFAAENAGNICCFREFDFLMQ